MRRKELIITVQGLYNLMVPTYTLGVNDQFQAQMQVGGSLPIILNRRSPALNVFDLA